MITETRMTRVSDKWHLKFLQLAKHYSSWSKDPSTKIGVVAINPETKTILSSGYNGFPRGITDSSKLLNARELKYRYMVHAEANCIYNATLNGRSLQYAGLYVYGLPVCSECAKAVIQVGVSYVIMKIATATTAQAERALAWQKSWELSSGMFDETGVEWYIHD